MASAGAPRRRRRRRCGGHLPASRTEVWPDQSGQIFRPGAESVVEAAYSWGKLGAGTCPALLAGCFFDKGGTDPSRDNVARQRLDALHADAVPHYYKDYMSRWPDSSSGIDV